jgi:hypothetical protein
MSPSIAAHDTGRRGLAPVVLADQYVLRGFVAGSEESRSASETHFHPSTRAPSRLRVRSPTSRYRRRAAVAGVGNSFGSIGISTIAGLPEPNAAVTASPT